MELEPGFECIIVARKPFKGNCIDNILKWGVGGLNIDECRVGNETISIHNAPKGTFAGGDWDRGSDTSSYRDSTGRFPANLILTYNDENKEEVCSGFPNTKSTPRTPTIGGTGGIGQVTNFQRGSETSPYNDSGSASRYFYNAEITDKDIEEINIENNTICEVGGNMKLYSGNDSYKLYQGDMLDMEEVIEPNSIDSIVTDPPYELNFMGKGWDNAGVSFQADTWKRCFNVLKPGGYLLAFGGSRTFHRIACAIEDAGFEIRDTIMWLYGSGFPKSMNIGLAIDKKNGVESKVVGYADTTMPDFRDVGKKQKELIGIDKLTFGQIENSERKAQPIYEAQNKWQGWGTCLKPAFEPIIVARKPFKGSLVDNVLENGVGGLNIDECRVEHNEETKYTNRAPKSGAVFNTDTSGYDNTKNTMASANPDGRFPANVILMYGETDFDEVCGGFPNTKNITKTHIAKNSDNNVNFNASKQVNIIGYNDSGSASRYFYCAKASKKDRDEGLEEFEEKLGGGMTGTLQQSLLTGSGNVRNNMRKNTHPTVKPCDLMQYLIRLVTPNGGIILDPFNGSGSTGKAAMYENLEKNKDYKYIGIELTDEYLPISQARIEYVINKEKE